MDNLLERLIDQLDTLVSFLGISHQDVFELILTEKNVWYSEANEPTLPDSYEVYRTQISHSAFLLGYSYFEAFLADLVRDIYLTKPKMLPSEKQLKFDDILNVNTYTEVLDLMIEKEVFSLFYKGMDKIIEYFEQKLNLCWPEDLKEPIIVASYLRNCIIHNKSLADDRLAQISQYNVGDSITLTSVDVNSYGISVRSLARSLFQNSEEKYFQER